MQRGPRPTLATPECIRGTQRLHEIDASLHDKQALPPRKAVQKSPHGVGLLVREADVRGEGSIENRRFHA